MASSEPVQPPLAPRQLSLTWRTADVLIASAGSSRGARRCRHDSPRGSRMGTVSAPCGWSHRSQRVFAPRHPPSHQQAASLRTPARRRARRPRAPAKRAADRIMQLTHRPVGRSRGATPALPARRQRHPGWRRRRVPCSVGSALRLLAPVPAPDEGDCVNSPTPAPLRTPTTQDGRLRPYAGAMTTATLLLSHASSQPPGGKGDHSQALAPGRGPRSRQADLVRD
jgi:hypothetical protein